MQLFRVRPGGLCRGGHLYMAPTAGCRITLWKGRINVQSKTVAFMSDGKTLW
jgi:hypothetical protein